MPKQGSIDLQRRLAGRKAHTAATAFIATALAGCMSLAPPHEAPPLPVPDAYPVDGRSTAVSGASAQNLPWRSYFTDPTLQKLIEAALADNRDLRKAVLRVDEARAAFGIQRADRFPSFNIDTQSARARLPGDLSVTGEPVVSGEYRAEVGLSNWELDLWGRVRNLETSALQSWLANDAARQAVRVALIAQVADGYLGLRELDERVAIARQTVASREESYRIFRRRFEVGSTSKLELTQVLSLLTQARSLHAKLEQARAAQSHALAQLVGSDPGPLPQAPLDESAALAELQPGLPSELLANRPDILAAEHRLRAAHADIGAARAAFFPRIALTGSWGTASAELGGLFESDSHAWTFVPTLSLPIFDGGRRRAGLDLAEVRRDLAVTGYEQTIQAAFREVSDALSARHWLTEQLDIQRIALEAQTERARLAQLRYDAGSAAYLEVLDAQRDLLDAAQQLVQARRAVLSSRVALYAALGGGTDGPAGSALLSSSTR